MVKPIDKTDVSAVPARRPEVRQDAVEPDGIISLAEGDRIIRAAEQTLDAHRSLQALMQLKAGVTNSGVFAQARSLTELDEITEMRFDGELYNPQLWASYRSDSILLNSFVRYVGQKGIVNIPEFLRPAVCDFLNNVFDADEISVASRVDIIRTLAPMGLSETLRLAAIHIANDGSVNWDLRIECISLVAPKEWDTDVRDLLVLLHKHIAPNQFRSIAEHLLAAPEYINAQDVLWMLAQLQRDEVITKLNPEAFVWLRQGIYQLLNSNIGLATETQELAIVHSSYGPEDILAVLSILESKDWTFQARDILATIVSNDQLANATREHALQLLTDYIIP